MIKYITLALATTLLLACGDSAPMRDAAPMQDGAVSDLLLADQTIADQAVDDQAATDVIGPSDGGMCGIGFGSCNTGQICCANGQALTTDAGMLTHSCVTGTDAGGCPVSI